QDGEQALSPGVGEPEQEPACLLFREVQPAQLAVGGDIPEAQGVVCVPGQGKCAVVAVEQRGRGRRFHELDGNQVPCGQVPAAQLGSPGIDAGESASIRVQPDTVSPGWDIQAVQESRSAVEQSGDAQAQ